jgi:hypothetical protein
MHCALCKERQHIQKQEIFRDCGQKMNRNTTKNEQKEKIYIYSQPSRLEIPEELQLHHNHEKFLFSTLLLLFAQCKMHNW